jgi:hypothetical protein
VQHFGKGLSRGAEVKAFAWGVVVGGDEAAETAGRERGEVGFAGDEAAHSSDGVFDAALLPRRVWVAEEGFDRQTAQREVASELGAIVEGDGLTERLRQTGEQIEEMSGDAVRCLAGQSDRQQEAGLALMHGQDRLAVFCEHHQVGLPMSAGGAIGDLFWPVCHGNTAFNEVCRASALSAAAASFALAAGQIVPPAVVLGAGKLGVDETIDALIGDHLAALLALEPAGDLFGRPPACEPLNDGCSQALVSFQARSLPAPGPGLLLGVTRFVPHLGAAIALQLPRDR